MFWRMRCSKSSGFWDTYGSSYHVQTTRPCIIINKKKELAELGDFAVSTDYWVKLKESEKKKRQVPGHCLGIEKNVEHESDGDTNCNWGSWNSHQIFWSRTECSGNKRMSWNTSQLQHNCDISTLDGTSLKLVDKFTYVGSSISSTEKDIDTRLTKAWTAINRLSIIWKSDLTDTMTRSFFQAAVVSILLYGCITWTLTKRLKKKRDDNYTRILRAILNKSWRQHPTKHQLYGHLPPITKTIQVRRTRHAGHCWRSKDELITNVLLWTPAFGQAKAGRPARTYIQQLCENTRCSPEDLPKAMNDREKWRERVMDIRASGTTAAWKKLALNNPEGLECYKTQLVFQMCNLGIILNCLRCSGSKFGNLGIVE